MTLTFGLSRFQGHGKAKTSCMLSGKDLDQDKIDAYGSFWFNEPHIHFILPYFYTGETSSLSFPLEHTHTHTESLLCFDDYHNQVPGMFTDNTGPCFPFNSWNDLTH